MSKYKSDYKHTPLGWIPIDWDVKEIGEFSKVTSGGTPDRKNLNYWNGTIPWISTSLIDFNTITQASEFITEEGLKNSSAKLFDPGTILIAMYGQGKTRGKVAKLGITATTNQACAAIIVNEKADKDYLFQYFTANYKNIRKLSNSGSQENLNGDLIKSLNVKLPPLFEQRKIAAVLNTWDEAITKTRQLITQLQQRNKGLIQELLTGKKRLMNSKSIWKKTLIDDVAKEISLKNKEQKSLTVLSCTKYDGLVDSLEYFGRKIYSEDTSAYKIVPINHFAYATNHIEEGSIGYQSKYKEALISPMYTVFKTNNDISDEYLYKLLKSHIYIHEYNKRMEGSIDRRGGLRWDSFSKINVFLPPLEEQIAIATVLNKVEDEVYIYKKYLSTLQQQKKALMQKLLTGEVRVKI